MIIEQLLHYQNNIPQLDIVEYYQQNLIPVLNINNPGFSLDNPTISKQLYQLFFEGTGALIIRGAYSQQQMEQYNKWCEETLELVKMDGNIRHPKQKDKYLINNVIDRMSTSNPDLLVSLLTNPYLTYCMDSLLGFGKIGSCTTHWIEPGGDRQLSHVDYPIHIGSGDFWENSVEKAQNLITDYQLNHILPYYSIQILIASDKMNQQNGSTELIPCSHRLENIDYKILDNTISNSLEPYFINADLQQGDFLIFNRRLCHRGGKNISSNRRNSLIIQSIWLWGIGQEIINSSIIIDRLVKTSNQYQQLADTEKEKFQLRIDFPYPKDVSKST